MKKRVVLNGVKYKWIEDKMVPENTLPCMLCVAWKNTSMCNALPACMDIHHALFGHWIKE